MYQLDFERLDVFQVSVDFVSEVYRLCDRLGKGRSRLRDQLFRAAMSVLLNIAEGAGEYSPAEKAHFFRIALRSLTECVGCLVIMVRLGWVSPDDVTAARRFAYRIVSMLTKMIHSVEARIPE